MINLNERIWVESMLDSLDLGNKPVYTLSRVCRYYMDKGYSDNEARCMVEGFLLQCDPRASVVLWNNTLDIAQRIAKKNPLIEIDSINVSGSELERIKALDGKQIQRLAFTLLCLSKYWNDVNQKNNNWVNTKDSEIMKLANIKTSSKRQDDMFRTLRDSGYIKFAKKIDSLNTCVVFADNDEPVLRIDDFRNLGFQYIKATGGEVFECENCGLVMKSEEKKRGRNKMYCQECAIKINIQKTLGRMARYRNAS